MESTIIWIDYHPRIYQDLLLKVFDHFSRNNPGCRTRVIAGSLVDGAFEANKVRVALLSLDKLSGHQQDIQNRLPPDSKLIAFPPAGSCGWVLKHSSKKWEFIYPFELSWLLSEAFGSAAG